MAKGQDLILSKTIFNSSSFSALIAYKLNKALAHEADDDELEVEVATELANYAEFVLKYFFYSHSLFFSLVNFEN
jgi:hypothetical protein